MIIFREEGDALSVEIAVKEQRCSMLIDLKPYESFLEIVDELNKRLKSIDVILLGSEIRIDLGTNKIHKKQEKEIKKIVESYGFNFIEILFSNEKDHELELISEEKIRQLDEIPFYDDTLMISRHLRSGQKIFHEGNIAVLGDVNPGAEIIAGGNIMVMGSMRGMAHAGALGDEKAVVVAFRLNPTQLRIASHITRPPDNEKNASNFPEITRIKDGRVMIEKLKI